MNTDNFWLCLYQYSGQETEGHLQSMEKFICEAEDETEALFKYHIWISIREKRRDIIYKSLSEYRKSEYASGGWGFCAYKLDIESRPELKSWRDDTPWFYEKYYEYAL